MLYTSGLSRVAVNQTPADKTKDQKQSGVGSIIVPESQVHSSVTYTNPNVYVFDTSKNPPPSLVVGSVPPPARPLDKHSLFRYRYFWVMDWGHRLICHQSRRHSVQTRLSKLYDSLFGALGDFAPAIEYSLFVVAVFLPYRTDRAFYWLPAHPFRYRSRGPALRGYQHINRGDFSHRIAVRSSDQLPALANSSTR